ncbi:hypothetical protein CA14_010886 [Aspergillus flavus]|uniref:Uncharacterized protein n=1 Tax=Aspergillus flavus TaxID=5059 RepID=A0AB74CI52_ASPFL|nr:hypothetical protein CA14_010886 [Aspergillus flavus]
MFRLRLATNTWNSTLSGLLMFAFDVWYLISEMKILSRDLEREPVAIDRISKVLLTSQVGLVPLALLVTLPAAS